MNFKNLRHPKGDLLIYILNIISVEISISIKQTHQ